MRGATGTARAALGAAGASRTTAGCGAVVRGAGATGGALRTAVAAGGALLFAGAELLAAYTAFNVGAISAIAATLVANFAYMVFSWVSSVESDVSPSHTRRPHVL
jgi:hypothetical protein